MPTKPLPQFPAQYPDVLGAITGGVRVNLEHLQAAFGIFPQRVFLNQPFEVFLLLQNMVNEKLDMQIELKLPVLDSERRKVQLDTPKTSIGLTLGPAEVGIWRTPVSVRTPPSVGGVRLPLYANVKPRPGRKAQIIRPPDGGPLPSVLSLSPFKLLALRDLGFKGEWTNNGIKTYVDVESRALPPVKSTLQTRFESLWAQQALEKERALASAKIQEARRVALGVDVGSAYPALFAAVDERFARAGMPLHPGEVRAIAKLMAYTIDEAPEIQAGYLEHSSWFQRLCQTLAGEPNAATMHRDDIILQYLFEALLEDSVLMGFEMLKSHIKENLGDAKEQREYARRVVKWLLGQSETDLTYIYLPLVLAGAAVDRMVTIPRPDDPYALFDQLREARDGRVSLISGEATVIFDMLETILRAAEDEVRRSGYRR
jgi:hypothetical protein